MSRNQNSDTVPGATLAARRQVHMGPRRRQFQTDAQGRRTAIVLPIAEYERLLDDVHDLAVAAERRDEPTMSLDELKRRLAKGGGV
jgi:hypothetical protein